MVEYYFKDIQEDLGIMNLYQGKLFRFANNEKNIKKE